MWTEKKYCLMATFGNENRKKEFLLPKKKVLSNGNFWEWEQKKGISTGEKKKEFLMLKFGKNKKQ